MRPDTQIVRQHKQESPFLCSACGADRGCDCNAPALERLKEIDQKNREKQRVYRDRMRANNESALRNAHIENTEENDDDAPEEDTPEDTLPIRKLVYRGIVEGLALLLTSPGGRALSDEFLREVFEEFLAKRRKVLK
jgi:hypothetical protein